jgi:histidinol-phosphate aminotransferase
MACGAASLKANGTILPERIAINRKNRELAFAQMDKLGVSYIPSATIFFMTSVKGMTAAQVYTAMESKKIVLGGANRWPEWPQHIRVTVGTYEEMGKFNAALAQVLNKGRRRKAKRDIFVAPEAPVHRQFMCYVGPRFTSAVAKR